MTRNTFYHIAFKSYAASISLIASSWLVIQSVGLAGGCWENFVQTVSWKTQGVE